MVRPKRNTSGRLVGVDIVQRGPNANRKGLPAVQSMKETPLPCGHVFYARCAPRYGDTLFCVRCQEYRVNK